MPSRRFKIWLLLTAVISLVGVFSGILLAGSLKKNAIYADGEVLSPANQSAALARVQAASSVDDIQDPEESASSFGSSTTNGSATTSDSDSSEPVFVHGLTTHHTVAKEYSLRMMEDASDQVCDVYQPDVPNDCSNLAGTGINYTYRRAAQAVGHLEIDDDGISCSGVLLDGDSKTLAYFLTAAKCLPNEKNVGRARIRFTGVCAGANSYTKSTVYAISRRLGYVILRVEANVKVMRERYSFLRLRAATRVEGEEVFIVHNSIKRGLQRITTQVHGVTIKTQEHVDIQGCVVESPRSRVSYVAPRMDRVAVGAPVLSTADGAIVGLHLCGDCSVSSQNSALKSNAILVDLDNMAQSINGFAQKPHTKK